MALRFCANLNFLFCESGAGILEKFQLAKRAGFRGVELPCPDNVAVESVVAAQKDNDLDIVLLNVGLGKFYNKETRSYCFKNLNFTTIKSHK